MRIIINSNCPAIPENSTPLPSTGNAVLHLLAALEYDITSPPVADLLKKIHQLEGNWLVLSPIHWQATHNNAMIMAVGKAIGLTDEQFKTWFNLYSEYLAADGLALHYHDPEHWLLCVDNLPPTTAKPAHLLLNKPLMPELAQLDSSMFWQKFVTESQMFFASHSHDTLLNGIWPWGGSQSLAKKSITLCADEMFLRLAQHTQTTTISYNASISLKQVQVLLLNDLTSLSPKHLDELNTLSAHWYWNDCAYSQLKRNWFNRLWRK